MITMPYGSEYRRTSRHHSSRRHRSRTRSRSRSMGRKERKRSLSEECAIENEVQRRVDAIVEQRVEDDIKRRVAEIMTSDDVKKKIEAKVREAKIAMEASLVKEVESTRQRIIAEAARKEKEKLQSEKLELENALKIQAAQRAQAEAFRKGNQQQVREMEEVAESKRIAREQAVAKELIQKEEQNRILGRRATRPKVSFGFRK